ncbi:MAG TPA: hypothetical protein VEL74_21950 [Thermoanaerobaculia bacterium]|nr:hypothetical protein [Thermoanaerobaculia bacterium]
MSIRDFHSKFASATPENALFAALRRLSESTDLKSLVTTQDFAWGDWTVE